MSRVTSSKNTPELPRGDIAPPPALPIPNFDPRIDTLRGLACIMVVVLHVAAGTFHKFGPGWWASNTYDSFSRPCIPIFLMISGALLLRVQLPLGEFLRRRFLRIVPALVFWSAVYAAWHASSLDPFLASMARALTGPVKFHLWYLYALIGLYAFTPIIAAFYRTASDAEKLYFIALWIAVASIFPIVNKVFELHINIGAYKLAYFGGLIGYFVAGAYLYDKARSSPRAAIACFAAYIAFSAATALATYLYSVAAGKPRVLFYDYLSPFVMIASVALFWLFLARPVTGRVGQALQFVSRFSLGIYCVHILVLDLFGRMPFMAFGRTGAAWVFIPLLAICVLTVSIAIIWLMRLLPPLRLVT